MVLVILAFASVAGGYGFLDLATGCEIFTGCGRSAGMGEAGLVTDRTPFCILMNPASLTGQRRPQVAATYRLGFLEESRSLPVYDSFDALLGYEVYSMNSNIDQGVAFGIASGRMPRLLDLCLGVVYSPIYDFRYQFAEEVRDRNSSSVPTDTLIANNFVEGTGTIDVVSFGVARDIGQKVSGGVSIDYLFGDYDLTSRVAWRGSGGETRDAITASNISGLRWRAGLSFRPTMRVEVGFSVTSKAELKGDFAVDGNDQLLSNLPVAVDTLSYKLTDGSITYPSNYYLGVSFRPRNELLTTLEAGVKYVRWSEFQNDALGQLNLSDIYEWHLGLEHVFYNNRALRFGFIYRTTPQDKEIAEAAATIGSNIEVGSFNVDVAGKVEWKDYRYPDLFDDGIFGQPSRLPGREWRDDVRETRFTFTLTISRAF